MKLHPLALVAVLSLILKIGVYAEQIHKFTNEPEQLTDGWKLSWVTEDQVIYRLERSSDLGSWEEVTTALGTGQNISRTDTELVDLDRIMFWRVEHVGNLNSTALDYGLRTSLEGPALHRLSFFLDEIANADIHPVWMVLGKSEFMGRSEATHHAVYGGDGSVGGIIENGVTGIGFPGDNENFEFANPIRGTTISEFSFWANASSENVTGKPAIISGYNGSSARGPSLSLGYSPTAGLPSSGAVHSGVHISSNGSDVLTRNSSVPTRIAGSKSFLGLNFSGTYAHGDSDNRPLFIIQGAIDLTACAATPITTAWNDTPTLRLGRRLDGGDALSGEIDFAMICDHALTKSQRVILYNSAKKNGIMTVSNPIALIAVGDSMTLGNNGATFPFTRTPQLMFQQNSGWKGGIYTNEARGGQAIDVQEGFYHNDTVPVLEMLPAFDRYVMFWGGYNSTAAVSTEETVRNALVDRYIAMALDAQTRGIQLIHWSYLIGGSADQDTNPDSFTTANAFNDYYAAQCKLHGFIWYDHRLTFNENQFDGSGRNDAYFVDSRHLSELGQATLVADFLQRFPNP